ncbi:transposase [Streptomyces sp. NPDC059819]|uniref:transposase n=1 Tax=Streptomyces sp. NPDC059819 TaxID=3346963 RepID=UPI0036605F1E
MDGRGRPWRDHRQVVNGVLWRLRTGAPWRDLPERYGPWQTVYERFARWEADGTWAKLLEHVQGAMTRSAGWSGPSLSTPRSTVPISTPPVPAKGGHARGGDELEDPGRSQTRLALGRSRGGLRERRGGERLRAASGSCRCWTALAHCPASSLRGYSGPCQTRQQVLMGVLVTARSSSVVSRCRMSR